MFVETIAGAAFYARRNTENIFLFVVEMAVADLLLFPLNFEVDCHDKQFAAFSTDVQNLVEIPANAIVFLVVGLVYPRSHRLIVEGF